jgi:hypothetical protein
LIWKTEASECSRPNPGNLFLQNFAEVGVFEERLVDLGQAGRCFFTKYDLWLRKFIGARLASLHN